MKNLLTKLEEISVTLASFSDLVLNICRSLFYLSAAIAFLYSSIHMHKLLTLSNFYSETLKELIGK